MKFDSNYDAAICLAHIRHPTGRFACELTVAGSPSATRMAAKLEAHAHILQVSALLTGLDMLKKKKLPRPNVLVTSDSAQIMRLLGNGRIDKIVIPNAMKERLKSELETVNATFLYNAHPRFLISLENWLFNLDLDILENHLGIISQLSAA
jgi:hypothetical protein